MLSLDAIGYRVGAWNGGEEPKRVRTFTRGERVSGETGVEAARPYGSVNESPARVTAELDADSS